MNFESLKKENRSITSGLRAVIYHSTSDVFAAQNAEIALIEAASMTNWGTEGGIRYIARGIDKKINKYLVIWDTTVAWDRAMEEKDENLLQDESYACEWDYPVSILLVDKAE